MSLFRLYQFSNDSGSIEFVVISELPKAEVIAEYATEEVECVAERTIEDDCTSFPCDRPLRRD